MKHTLLKLSIAVTALLLCSGQTAMQLGQSPLLFPPPSTEWNSLLVSHAKDPIIGEWNRTAKPGETITLTGMRFTLTDGTDTKVWIAGLDTDSLELGTIWKVTDKVLIVSIPADMEPDTYIVWVENGGPASSTPVVINRTQPEWLGPLGNIATPGSTKRVFGKNLSKDLGETESDVYIRAVGNTDPPVAVVVTSVEPLAVGFTVPASLTAGNYEVYVHNRHGGVIGWGGPLTLQVIDPFVRGATETIITEADIPVNRTPDIQAAIDAKTALTNGGTVRLGAGTFRISTQLNIKNNVRLVGAGKGQTIILGQGGTGIWLSAGANHVTIEDLTYKSDAGITGSILRSASFSGGAVNDDVLIRNVDLGLYPDTTSSIAWGFQGHRIEITGGVINGIMTGAPNDWWIHDNEFHGGRVLNGTQDGALQFSVQKSEDQGRIVIENNLAKTPNWPVGPTGSRNYNDFWDVPTFAQQIWCSRLVDFTAHSGSMNYSYIGHNTTIDVAIDQNKGEQILFHSVSPFKYAQVASNTGRVLTIRTDGGIDGDTAFTLNPFDTNPAIKYPAMTTIPDTIIFGTTIDGVAWVIVVDGTGIGQYRRVVSHTSTTVTVDSDWRIEPAADSKIMLDYIYLGHLQYKNDLSGVPVGWRETSHIASFGVNYDGNQFASIGMGNTSRRTYYSDVIQGYLTSPSYWNEIRDPNAIDAYKLGPEVTARGGDFTGSPTINTTVGALALGNWIRGGYSNKIPTLSTIAGGGACVTFGCLPQNKPFILGSGVEGGSGAGAGVRDFR